MERAGNLDWLRLVAAGMVFFSHQLAVFNLPNPEFFDGPAPGAIGVYIFFAISGYVNTKSILRKRSFISFLVARILRIYPGSDRLFTVLCCARQRHRACGARRPLARIHIISAA
jgi:peptidoglycan/LPS O-acetylase OafA/YrhL